MDILCNTKT